MAKMVKALRKGHGAPYVSEVGITEAQGTHSGVTVSVKSHLQSSPLLQWPRSRAQTYATLAANALIAASVPRSFYWTSLQFNKNTVAEPHRDRNNVGLSFILICGDALSSRST